MNRVPDPLDANERELAELLARDALPGPSPQMDARILAAARSASKPATTRRPRWIAGMGIAATLVLAVGIAWRLRPLPERQMARAVPVAAVRVAAPRDDSARYAADEVVSPQMQPRAQELPKAIPAERESTPARKPVPPETPVVFDEPSPMDTQTALPAPPPPAPIPAPRPAVANGMAAPAAGIMQADKAQAPATAPPDAFSAARATEDARTLDRVEVTGSRIDRNADAAAAADAAAEDGVPRAVLDEEPPATADSPQVQEAWLQRIRELLSAGETEAARNSLGEFRKRYPKYALPEDLRRFAGP